MDAADHHLVVCLVALSLRRVRDWWGRLHVQDALHFSGLCEAAVPDVTQLRAWNIDSTDVAALNLDVTTDSVVDQPHPSRV